MHTFSRHITLVLGPSLALARAQPDNLFLSDSLESTLNEQVDDTLFNSHGFILSEPEFASNSVNQDETDLFFDANDPVVGPSLLNLAKLPDSCGSEESSTDGLLQARDGTSCASGEEQFDLPIGLFEDPENYLRDNLPTPPTGQAGQFGQGMEDGDLGFAAFMRNRNPPISTPLNQDEQLCDRKRFTLSGTPMCSNPITGSVDGDMNLRNGFTLIDAVPYDPALGCPEPSELWCCAVIHIRARNLLVLDQSLFTATQLHFLARLNKLQRLDAYYCYK